MAKVVCTVKIMPQSPKANLDKIEKEALRVIAGYAGNNETKTTREPIAFGLTALNIIFILDESKGSTEPIEKSLAGLADVNSAEIVDVRRAIG